MGIFINYSQRRYAMTIAELIARVDTVRPNQFDNDMKVGWINEIENKVVKNVLNRYLWAEEEFEPYEYVKDAATILRVPDTHADVYETYLFAKMDYSNAEIDRYNADAAMHRSAWDDYAKEMRRENYPKPHGTAIHYITIPEG